MAKQKKKEILVFYGFHPDEKIAMSIGRSLKDLGLDGVDTIRFTPKVFQEGYDRDDFWIYWDKCLEGNRETKKYIRSLEGQPRFTISLHDTRPYRPGLTPPEKSHLEIGYPISNDRLKKVLERFAEKYEKIEILVEDGDPILFPRPRSCVIEYMPKDLRRKTTEDLTTKGISATIALIGHIRTVYP